MTSYSTGCYYLRMGRSRILAASWTFPVLIALAGNSHAAVGKPDSVGIRVEAVKGSEFEKGLVRRISARIRKAKGLVLGQADPDYILKVAGQALAPSKKGQAPTHYIVSISFLANFREAYKAKLIAAVEKEYKARTKKFLGSDLVLFSDQVLHHGRLDSIEPDCAALADVFIRALSPNSEKPVKQAAKPAPKRKQTGK